MLGAIISCLIIVKVSILSQRTDCKEVLQEIRKEKYRIKIKSVNRKMGDKFYTVKGISNDQKLTTQYFSIYGRDIGKWLSPNDSLIKLGSSATLVVVKRDSSIFFELECESLKLDIIKLNRSPYLADFTTITSLETRFDLLTKYWQLDSCGDRYRTRQLGSSIFERYKFYNATYDTIVSKFGPPNEIKRFEDYYSCLYNIIPDTTHLGYPVKKSTKASFVINFDYNNSYITREVKFDY